MSQREDVSSGCLGRRRFLGLSAAVPALTGISLSYVSAQELPPVAGRTCLDPLKTEGFGIRQPQHIELAAHLGLGTFDFNYPKGKKNAVQQHVVNVA